MGAACCRSVSDENNRHCETELKKAERHTSDKDRYASDPTRYNHAAAAVSASVASAHAVEQLLAEGNDVIRMTRSKPIAVYVDVTVTAWAIFSSYINHLLYCQMLYM